MAEDESAGQTDTRMELPRSPGYFATKVCEFVLSVDSCELKSTSFLTIGTGSPPSESAAVCPIIEREFLAALVASLTTCNALE